MMIEKVKTLKCSICGKVGCGHLRIPEEKNETAKCSICGKVGCERHRIPGEEYKEDVIFFETPWVEDSAFIGIDIDESE